jgi:hypothetical protein
MPRERREAGILRRKENHPMSSSSRNVCITPAACITLSSCLGLMAFGSALLLGCSSDDGSASLVGDATTQDPTDTPSDGVGEPPLAGVDGLVTESEVPVGGACASSVAAETFTSALCSCEDSDIAGYLRTRSFRSSSDSLTGASGADQLGGSVSVNRDYITAGFADVGGSFVVAGSRDIAFGGYLKSGQDVLFNPRFDVAGLVEVGRDAWLASAVRAFGRVEIGRDLYRSASAGFQGIALVDVGGAEHTQAVDIEPPCACAPEQIIDVAALVAAAESDNDNAAAGLDPDAFDVVVGIGADIRLPGGRYYVDQVGGLGSVTLHVGGDTALFVAGDLVTTGLFRVELEPGAELDLFVRDDLVVTGAALFGDPARPAATRIYVGGTGDVAIAGASAFVGNLYAPTANVLIGGVGRVEGSLFGKNIVAAGFLSVGYDESIQERGEDCPPVAEGDLPYIR